MDIELLAELVTGDALRVAQHGERFYLRAAEFEGIDADDSASVDRRATEIVRILNAAAQVSLGDHQPISVGAAALVREDGSIRHFVHASSSLKLTARIRTKGSVPGQPEPEGPSPTERIALRGLSDPIVELALRMFGRDDTDYRDLYFVFEIVEAAVGGRMYEEAWASKAEVSRFTRTANSRTALGEDARHANERTEPPSDPMPFEEARELVRRLLAAWLA